MRGVIYDLQQKGRISPNLLSIPDQILICAEKYIVERLCQVSAETKDVDLVKDQKEPYNGRTTEGETKDTEENMQNEELPDS